jgi:hypothetical protein
MGGDVSYESTEHSYMVLWQEKSRECDRLRSELAALRCTNPADPMVCENCGGRKIVPMYGAWPVCAPCLYDPTWKERRNAGATSATDAKQPCAGLKHCPKCIAANRIYTITDPPKPGERGWAEYAREENARYDRYVRRLWAISDGNAVHDDEEVA